ncbi:MAG: hypothetical protein U1F67_04295 [Rubrivivax sp.]
MMYRGLPVLRLAGTESKRLCPRRGQALVVFRGRKSTTTTGAPIAFRPRVDVADAVAATIGLVYLPQVSTKVHEGHDRNSIAVRLAEVPDAPTIRITTSSRSVLGWPAPCRTARVPRPIAVLDPCGRASQVYQVLRRMDTGAFPMSSPEPDALPPISSPLAALVWLSTSCAIGRFF